jgi:hypothetical protein
VGVREKITKNVQPLLQPGETIQAVFAAQSTSQWFALISIWIIVIKNSYRSVIVTDRRILVCRAGRLTLGAVKGVLRELPRATQIGPASGLWYKTDALGETLYIHKRFHKDVAAADGTAA